MKGLIFTLAIAASIGLSAQTARLQVIHNSADLAADSVDVYLGNTELLPDFKFRTATPFIDAPAGVPITIGIAPGTSSDVSDTIYSITTTLIAGETYVAVANGIVSLSGYSPATPFSIYPFASGREAATMTGNTDILVFHGSTDAPEVSIDVTGVGTVVDSVDYGEFAGYLEVQTADITLEVRSKDGSVLFASYDAPLATLMLQDAALVAVASGFLNPGNNSMGAGFGLWVALPAGGDLVELPVNSGLGQEEILVNQLNLYPNPANGSFSIEGAEFETAEMIDMAGNRVKSWSESQEVYDVQGIPAGVYMFKATSANETFVQRVVLQ